MPKSTLNSILEIGAEEIPARFMPEILEDFKAKAEAKVKEARLSFSSIKTLGTSRRLVLYIENISKKQEDIAQEVKGPPAEFAFDQDNKPTKAAQGFARSQKVSLKDLQVKTVEGKNYVFAVRKEKGLPAAKVLANVFPEIIKSLYLPIAMRWGEGDFKFIRPLHYLVAACGKKTVKFELAGIKSHGSRVAGREKIIIDDKERKEVIKTKVILAARKVGARPLLDPNLLSENTFLVESPEVLVGTFSKDFLSLPQDVLSTTMKKNQKYFPLLDKNSKLINKFVIVTEGKCQVREGNERVLSARLADAKFFFEEDLKIPLRMRVEDLKKVEFYEKLGTLYDKKERLKKLAGYLAREFRLEQDKLPFLEKIAEFCKADLTSNMVFEFPELQGIMGREYSRAQGDPEAVAQGIFEHWLPRFAGDELPESAEGTIISLADKIDSIVGCFGIGLVPSGSEDPYGLRRQAHGIVSIVLKRKIDLSLEDAIEKAYKLYAQQKDLVSLRKEILEFIAIRLKNILLEEGVRHDAVEAALCEFNNILAAYRKAKIIHKMAGEDFFKGIILAADRVTRLAVNAKRENVLQSDFAEDGERKLYALFLKVNWQAGEAIKAGNFEAAIRKLADLTLPIDEFFQKTMVMHEDERLKLNRLALLKSLEKLYKSVADFQKIVV